MWKSRTCCAFLFCLILAICLAGKTGAAQPHAGDVLREFTFNEGAKPGTHISELDPGTKRDFGKEHAWAKNKPRHVPHAIDLDLEGAARAEISVEFWGGHIGTSGQKFSVNDNPWIDLPQPQGTPGRPECFYRTLLGNNAVPIPLAHLRHGKNAIRFAAGPQIRYGFDFGFFWIYAFTIRVYYGAAKPHVEGQIILPRPGGEVGDNAELGVRVAGDGAKVKRVEFLAECDDFDWDGDGIWREWQYQTRYGTLHHHVGTANAPPYPVSVFYNVAGNGSRWQRQDLSQDGVYAAVLADVGSDGALDIVGPQSYWRGPIKLWENKAGKSSVP